MNVDNRITILHLCEHFGGKSASLHGVARTFQWWLPLFDASEFRIVLCSRKGHDKAAEQMEAQGSRPLYLAHGKFDPRNLSSLLAIVKRENVRIIHAHGFGASMWARVAGHIKNIPVIVHGRANYRKTPLPMRPVEYILGPRTRYALAVSKSTADFMIKQRHIPEETVKVVYNGLPLEKISIISTGKRREIREKHGITDSQTVIGIVGRIVSHKGHIDLFTAVKNILDKQPSLQIWVAGDGDYLPRLKQWLSTNEMSEKVTFLGFVNNAIEIIQCFDIQVFPSHMEGTPNTLFEALAVGNRIVASDTDGQAEVLENGRDALVYKAGDTKALADCLRKVINNRQLGEKLSHYAEIRSRSFDGKKTVKEMETLYRRICSENTPPC